MILFFFFIRFPNVSVWVEYLYILYQIFSYRYQQVKDYLDSYWRRPGRVPGFVYVSLSTTSSRQLVGYTLFFCSPTSRCVAALAPAQWLILIDPRPRRARVPSCRVLLTLSLSLLDVFTNSADRRHVTWSCVVLWLWRCWSKCVLPIYILVYYTVMLSWGTGVVLLRSLLYWCSVTLGVCSLFRCGSNSVFRSPNLVLMVQSKHSAGPEVVPAVMSS